MGVLTIREAALALSQGRWVAAPTMDRYVLVCCARERAALASLRALGEGGEPFGLLLRRPAELNGLIVGPLPRRARRLVGEFWPGGLALELPGDSGAVPRELLSNNNGLWVYQDGYPLLLQLLDAVGRPLARLALPGASSRGAVFDARLADQGRYAGHVGCAETPGDGASTLVSLLGGAPEVLCEGAVSAEAVWASWEAPLR